eukprot:1184179-Prorocentrum_minimum.AAC.9
MTLGLRVVCYDAARVLGLFVMLALGFRGLGAVTPSSLYTLGLVWRGFATGCDVLAPSTHGSLTNRCRPSTDLAIYTCHPRRRPELDGALQSDRLAPPLAGLTDPLALQSPVGLRFIRWELLFEGKKNDGRGRRRGTKGRQWCVRKAFDDTSCVWCPPSGAEWPHWRAPP